MPQSRRTREEASEIAPDGNLDELLEFLKRERGFDFRGYKRPSLARRIQKRMQSVGAESYTAYIAILEREPREFDHLFNAVLINVTAFFRDTVPWDYLSRELVPRLVGQKPPEAPIRVWSAGCASGQEAFSLAMILAECLGLEEFLRRVKIYATDLDEDALNYARAASYTEREIEGVPETLRERYFERQGTKYAFRKEIRRAVIFGRNDLVQNAPISRIDLLVCRNTLMYFDAATQARIVRRFHFALNEGGYLLLGKAEALSTRPGLFAPVDVQRRVFTKVEDVRTRDRARAVPRENEEPTGETTALCGIAFEKSGLAQFVVNRKGIFVLANERARTLFRVQAADIGRSFHELEASYRPVELRSLIDQIFIDERAVKLTEARWPMGGEDRWFDVQLIPLYEPKRVLAGVTISFDDVTVYRRLKLELQHSHTRLQSTVEELQSTNEELETTNEELQSTVEELETTNEELQSTNEELETMNEELQSINEEHGAVNEELRLRSTELNELNAYLGAIFESLRGGVAILDAEMRIKIWNRRAEDLWGVRSDEAVNQPFGSLDIGLPVKDIKQTIRASMNGGGGTTETRVTATNRRGRTIQCRVASTPLIIPGSDKPQGAIVVMEEATA
jgi:two-component system, chemotaxis family, CheB/CheR fusion protein